MMISGYKSKDPAKDRQLMECALLEYLELPVDFYSIKMLPKSPIFVSKNRKKPRQIDSSQLWPSHFL